MPKKSRYNHFQRWNDDYYIAYNSRSGAVALMDPENYETYHSVIGKLENGGSEMNENEAALLKQLQYGSFVCPDDFDECGVLEFAHNINRYGASDLGLVIAPTMACNMACKYCYEENKTGRMSPEMIEVLVDFVKKRARALAHLDVTWYGGEPLLAMDIIEQLSAKFIEMGDKDQYDYAGMIVTNGYLLTPDVADRLRELKVHGGQITVDGPAALHNEKRPLKNGGDSFETILKNIEHAADLMRLSVRVNIDRSFTAEMVGQLLTELDEAGLREKISVNFGHLEPATEVCSNIAESCYETNAFAEVETDYYRMLLERGFRIDKIPSPTSVCCMAQVVNSFIVDPEGQLYRCWNYVGNHAKSMGNIKNQLNFQHPNFLQLFSTNPFKIEACRDCSLLPICMGGCPSRRVDRNLSGEEMCESWKYNLEPMLEIIAASKQQEAQRAAKEQT